MAASMKSRSRRVTAVFCSIFLVYLTLLAPVWSHEHGHSHGADEPPAHKYSKQANEPEHAHGHSHGDAESFSGQQPEPPRAFDLLLWGRAIGATFVVCCAPVLILIAIPLDRSDEHQPLLKVLLSFASGGLLGDAFLHLIPHAITPHDHSDPHAHSHEDHGHAHEDHGHSHSHGNGMTVGLWVLGGIVAFLMVEKFVRLVKGGHGHSHGPPQKPPADEKKTAKKGKKDKKEPEEGKNPTNALRVTEISCEFVEVFVYSGLPYLHTMQLCQLSTRKQTLLVELEIFRVRWNLGWMIWEMNRDGEGKDTDGGVD